MKNTNYLFVGLGDIQFFETNKYEITIHLKMLWTKNTKKRPFIILYEIEKFLVFPKIPFHKRIFRKVNKKCFSLDPILVSGVLPNVEDLLIHSKWLSDNKINYQIDRLLKLKAFM